VDLNPETRNSLLIELRDPANQQAWQEFTDIYRPLVYRLARMRGLQHADADDLSQQVLLSVAGAIGRWESDPQRARFRTWLKRVADNAITNALTRMKPDQGTGRTSVAIRLHAEPVANGPSSELLCIEYQREVFQWAARQIKDEFRRNTWDAFWLTSVEGVDINEVADQLNKSRGAIYIARSRVIRRLNEKVQSFDDVELGETK